MSTRQTNRRTFLKSASSGMLGALLLPAHASRSASNAGGSVPSYLKDYVDVYRQDPKRAALAWFANAKYGLFMHYGVYSLLGRGEWVMLREAIPVAEYSKLKDRFTAEKFDADFITDMALDAEMKYINLTAKHHDSFCLFRTGQTDFQSLNAPARRDLIAELAEQCEQKGLGLFLYYSLYADWRHPYFYSRDAGWKNARPNYKSPEPSYKWRRDEDFKIYLDFARAQLAELLTQYGPIAGIWLDPIMGFYHRPDLFPIGDIYAQIRGLQRQVLISSKQGANGDEDFAAPERSGHGMADRFSDPELQKAPREAWESNKDKHNEICDTLQPRVWGYKAQDAGKHRTADEVVDMLQAAWAKNCNLLLNTGPLPDGSINPVDEKTLRDVGRRIRAGLV